MLIFNFVGEVLYGRILSVHTASRRSLFVKIVWY